MGSASTSSWNGCDDNDRSNNDVSPRSPPSPFSAAFNTPRPAGILTNDVREVPSSVGEHPEDLYDALEVQFKREVLNNPEKKPKTRITWEERRHLIRHLTMSEDT
jgi:hypothetical protein